MGEHLHTDEDWLLEHTAFITGSCPSEPDILELGCGRGRDTMNLTKFGRVVALDIDESVLARCSSDVPCASVVRADLSKPLPFPDSSFDFVLASLAIHYFSWRETTGIVSEMRRCLGSSGRAIVRVNSTNDTNYGASSNDQIEPLYYQVGSTRKRFFDRVSMESLFIGWEVRLMEEKAINRYAKRKQVWEILLSVAEA